MVFLALSNLLRQVGGEDDPCLVLGACYSLTLDKDSHILSLDKLFMFEAG